MTSTLAAFDELKTRERIRADLVTVTALRVGAGKSFDASTTDQPVMRDALERPFIPGSSLKGSLRSGLESILRSINSDDLWACDPLDEKTRCTHKLEEKKKGDSKDLLFEEIEGVLCPVCGLFGSSLLAGRLFIHDLPLKDPDTAPPPELRDGVGIHRDLRTAQGGIKYDFEAVPPGTRFELEMLLENAGEVQLALTVKMLQLLDEGQILLGGLTTRGLGRVRLENVTFERTSAEQLLGLVPKEEDGTTWQARKEWSEETLRRYVGNQNGGRHA